jgi:ABC-type uncharacterized transport system involved in gliding motility auxiliary subunit
VKRLFGLLGWLGVVLVLGAVAMRFAAPEHDTWYRGLALAGLIVTAIYALSQWRDVARTFQGRNVKYGSIAAASVVVFLAILVAINYIGARENKRWDLTANQQYSLSDQTKKILQSFTKPLTVKVFQDPQQNTADRDALSEYQYAAPNFQPQFIDANGDPTQANAYKITTLPTVVFEYDGRTERTNGTDESSVTNSLKKLLEGKAKKIYFVQGHGEHDTADTQGKIGYGAFADALKTDNFDVASLTLAQAGKVPDDATLVAVAGPKTDFFPAEVDALRAYLKRGGKVLLMLDPPDYNKTTSAVAPPLTNLIALAHEWGIDVGNDLVVDVSGMGQMIGASEAVPIAMPAQGTTSPIVQDFKMLTAFPLARSASAIPGGVNGHVAQKLLETSERSWAETDLKALFATNKVEMNADKGDKAGPITIASAASGAAPDAPAAVAGSPAPEARVVVFGDSDFVSNSALGIQGNRDLILNAANWLAQQESLIAIHPRDPQDRGVQLTADQGVRIFWLAIVIIPGLLFLNGFRVWWKRR